MNPEIEKLIDMVVADGQITEKERGVVLKKAGALGEDIDEVEIYLDAKLHQKNEVQKQEVFPAPPLEKKSNKEGDLKKCPSCGAPAESFNTKCSDCGHEFRNVVTEKTIKALFTDLMVIEQKKSTAKDYTEKCLINDQMATLISTFPIPNSKESVLEFISQTYPKAKGHGSRFANIMNENGNDTDLRKAWRQKFEEAYIKAKFLFINEPAIFYQIQEYAKELKIK